MKRLALSLFLPFVLAPLGCDRDDDSDVADQARAADDADAPGAFGKHSPVDKLCALVSCTDEQREDIVALIPAPPPRARPDEAKRDAANDALADAFRSDAFSADALVAWRTAVHDGGKRPKPSAETIAGIHTILTSSQRDTLADLLEAHGPGALLGHGPGGKHHGDRKSVV